MTSRHIPDPDELLAQVSWVRSLALTVAGDAHAADDLAQDTLLVAMRGAREEPRSLRHWLARVVRNLGRTQQRGDSRRQRRESLCAGGEEAPSTLDLVERASIQRELVGAVLELDEPLRTTLLLRYFEQRSPREIAAQMNVPVSTVATRTQDALRRLRGRLRDPHEHGSRAAWLPSLFPLVHWPRPRIIGARNAEWSGPSSWIFPMKSLLCTIAAVGTLFALQRLTESEAVHDAAAAAPLLPESVELVAPVNDRVEVLAAGMRTASDREPLPSPTPQCLRTDDTRHARLIHGRVIDLTGQPVAGVSVYPSNPTYPPWGSAQPAGDSTPNEPSVNTTTDSAGAFRFEALPPTLARVRDARYATLYQGNPWAMDRTQEALIIVGWRIPLAGVVVDEEGLAIRKATLTVRAGTRILTKPGTLLGGATLDLPRTESDVLGSFEFDEMADFAGAELHVEAPGFEGQVLLLQRGGNEGLRVVLEHPHHHHRSISGRVVLPTGMPAERAWVSTGGRICTTDSGGRFALDMEHAPLRHDQEEPVTLSAGLPGYLVTSQQLPSISDARRAGWPTDIVLELGERPMTISGRIVDEEGNPMRGVHIETPDETRFGMVESSGVGRYSLRTAEEIAGGGETTSDALGRFQLKGLTQRAYRLEVMHRPSLLTVTTEPIEAGSTDVTVVLDRRILGKLRGRVVDKDGFAVAGIRVAVSRKRQRELAFGAPAVSDADGVFELSGVTTRPAFLRIWGDSIVPDIFHAIDADTDLEELSLRVGRRCHLQIAWGNSSERADRVRVLDETDGRLDILRLAGGAIGVSESLPMGQGLSQVFSISDAARSLVLLRDGEEVMRFALRPVPGEVEQVTL